MDAGFLGYLIAALAFLGLMALLAINMRSAGAVGVLALIASAATALWAAVVAHGFWMEAPFSPTYDALEVLRSGAWLAFLWVALYPVGAGASGKSWVKAVALGTVATLATIAAVIEFYPDMTTRWGLPCSATGCSVLGRLALALAGLLLVENLYRNTDSEQRWNIKHLCLGLGGLFAYDAYLYADAILTRVLDFDLTRARGVVDALVVPFLAVSAVRNRQWATNLFVSRRVVFHSASLIGAGVYMLLMAAAGLYIREVGEYWGPVLQTVFLFGAVVALAVIMVSGRMRSHLYVLLNKHFFAYRYDYREEWLRFIKTISTDAAGTTLADRAIRAVADIVDSPEGGLWLRDDDEHLVPTSMWNAHWPAEVVALDHPLARAMEARQWIVKLDDIERQRAILPELEPPDWLTRGDRAWLVVPLLHDDRLLGFIVLGQPRAPRDLNWEDYDLLKTVGRQVASYLALEQAARALAEARRFEAFSRRFAFVLHDIKNLVSQLSLMARNADKHKNNPAFQEDMIQTVRESVDKMNRLLVRLHADSVREAQSVAPIAPLLTKAVSAAAGKVTLDMEPAAQGLATTGDADRLTSVFDHLIQNAIEASPDGVAVEVRLRHDRGDAVIEVVDHGPGMGEAFVREALFRPFKSTKDGGFGIGVYESREYMREMGGRLEVDSAPGRGTTMRVTLPVIGADDETQGMMTA